MGLQIRRVTQTKYKLLFASLAIMALAVQPLYGFVASKVANAETGGLTTPQIKTPTERQSFNKKPIKTTWTSSTGGVVTKYQVAYAYDDGHSFSNSTCNGETINGVSVYCRDEIGTSRNHSPSDDEQGGVTVWVRAVGVLSSINGEVSSWSKPVHYFYDIEKPTSNVTSLTQDATVSLDKDGNLIIKGSAQDNVALNRMHVQLLTSKHGAINIKNQDGETIDGMVRYGNENGIYGLEKVDWQVSFNIKKANLSDGPYAISYKAVDRAGNVEDARYIDFSIDSTAPDFTIDSPSNKSTIDTTDGVVVSGTVTDDPAGVAGVWVYVNRGGSGKNGNTVKASIDGNSWSAKLESSEFNDGETVKIIAYPKDELGNQKTKSVEVTVANSSNSDDDTTNPPQEGPFDPNQGTGEPTGPVPGEKPTIEGVDGDMINPLDEPQAQNANSIFNRNFALNLDANDEDTATDQNEPQADTLGDSTANAATGEDVKGAADEKAQSGLAWYWWALIVAAVAAIWWWIAAARKRNQDA